MARSASGGRQYSPQALQRLVLLQQHERAVLCQLEELVEKHLSAIRHKIQNYDTLCQKHVQTQKETA